MIGLTPRLHISPIPQTSPIALFGSTKEELNRYLVIVPWRFSKKSFKSLDENKRTIVVHLLDRRNGDRYGPA